MFLKLLYIWFACGLLTVLLVSIKPPRDVKFWALWCLLIGPVGLACFAALAVLAFLRGMRGAG